jgi:hypothetical protein
MTALADDQAPLQIERGPVALAGLIAHQLRRLAGEHAVQPALADVHEVVEAVRVPERPFGEDESRGQALGLRGFEQCAQRVGHRRLLTRGARV